VARPRGAKARAAVVAQRLAELYPVVRTALDHRSPYELLVATILSAQTTDERVNMVTPALFDRYPQAVDLAHADPADVEGVIKSTGFFRAKTKSIIGMAQALEERFGGEVPTELEDLVTVPGVGRKTANVVRSNAFGLPGLPVDTHVTRLSRRLKLTSETDPVKIEFDLNALIPPEGRGDFSLRLIEHGRRVCIARWPRCGECVLNDVCPSAFKIGPPPKQTAKPAKSAKKPSAKPKPAKTVTASNGKVAAKGKAAAARTRTSS
jgi:endonuclease-3